MVFSFAAFPYTFADENKKSWLAELDEIEKRVNCYIPDPQYPDDPFILVTIREVLVGSRENNGGIGACLVREATGEIVEKGHNRQYEPYFHSDLHAEMDLLTRYEERVKAQRFKTSSIGDPCKIEGLVLYCSVEPCPMCLTRIINMGLKKVYFAVPDPDGGMVQRIHDLPPFWKDKAASNVYVPANCSKELKDIAKQLFHPMQFKK
jgi:tRNA(adenine34) deaminase